MIHRIHMVLIGLLLVATACEKISGRRCNRLLLGCEGEAPYCTFGYKWGEGNDFSPNGLNTPGPGIEGGTVTFSFRGEGENIRTHAQTDVVSQSWDEDEIPCARDQIRAALERYSAIAQIDFVEVHPDVYSDIRFYVAEIEVTGVAFPNFTKSRCSDLSGQATFNSTLTDCHAYYMLVLHEIGHLLGLGHVSTRNVMNPHLDQLDLDSLQAGDIAGIQSIYGAR